MINPRLVFPLIIPAVALCIIGLLTAQVLWFRDASSLKEDQFREKVFILSSYINRALEADDNLSKRLSQKIKPTHSSCSQVQPINAANLTQELYNLIRSVFQANDFNTPFHFVLIRNCSLNEIVLSDLPITEAKEKDFQFGEMLSCVTPKRFGQYHLGFNFPQKEQYLWKQVGGLLLLSILLIWFLLGAFAYLIWIIRRQKKLSEIKNDFINNLSHEFKTPIASIALASKVLKKSPTAGHSKEELSYLQLITNESKRLENQVDSILQMAMLDSGNFILDKTRVNLHELILKVSESFTLRLKEINGVLAFQLNASQANIQGDPAHLFNLFYNLLDNAIKYTEQQPRIVITTKDTTEGFHFLIKDNGIGMKDSVKRHIFEKFYRATPGNIHNVKGFGLGLNYVKSIVDAHRGKINFNSILHQGTEFNVYLPTS